jgi:hypothetical protein
MSFVTASEISPIPNSVVVSGNHPAPRRSASRSPFPETVTSDQVLELSTSVRKILSDLSILRGEFCKDEYPEDHTNKIALLRSGYADMSQWFKFEDRIDRLKDRATEREALQQQDAENEGDLGRTVRNWDEQIVIERSKFEAFVDKHNTIVSDLRNLRRRFEAAGKGKNPIYDYQLAIRYQVIGNQVIPEGYKKKRAPRGSKVTPAKGTPAKGAAVVHDDSDDDDMGHGAPSAKKVKVANKPATKSKGIAVATGGAGKKHVISDAGEVDSIVVAAAPTVGTPEAIEAANLQLGILESRIQYRVEELSRLEAEIERKQVEVMGWNAEIELLIKKRSSLAKGK